MPSSRQTFLNASKSMSFWLIKRPETPLTPSDFRILRISFCSIVSVTTTQGISVMFTTELRSSLCMNIISVQYFSIWCWCLNSASKSFSDTAIRSFPYRRAASSKSFKVPGLDRFKRARFAPAYRIFFTSSWRRIFPPATMGMLMTRLIFFIRSMASSWFSSELDRSNTISSSAPRSP